MQQWSNITFAGARREKDNLRILQHLLRQEQCPSGSRIHRRRHQPQPNCCADRRKTRQSSQLPNIVLASGSRRPLAAHQTTGYNNKSTIDGWSLRAMPSLPETLCCQFHQRAFSREHLPTTLGGGKQPKTCASAAQFGPNNELRSHGVV